jgi:hypothetical protein
LFTPNIKTAVICGNLLWCHTGTRYKEKMDSIEDDSIDKKKQHPKVDAVLK